MKVQLLADYVNSLMQILYVGPQMLDISVKQSGLADIVQSGIGRKPTWYLPPETGDFDSAHRTVIAGDIERKVDHYLACHILSIRLDIRLSNATSYHRSFTLFFRQATHAVTFRVILGKTLTSDGIAAGCCGLLSDA